MLSTVLPIASCSYGPEPVRMASVDAAGAGSAAMEQFDTDGDGLIAGAELDQSPSLKSSLERLDSSGDDGISAEEIAARIEQWEDSNVALSTFGFLVTLDGQPLAGAKVVFEPEVFLGDVLQPAVGETGPSGRCAATVPKDQRPDPTFPPGVCLGFYKVKISKLVNGRESIPSRYNDATVLGQEVAIDVPEIINNRVVYALTSK
jgi:hypothetical protein